MFALALPGWPAATYQGVRSTCETWPINWRAP